MPKVGVCLSGCGYMDGAEIQEAVLTILALDRARAEMIFMAPDIPQTTVVDHQTGEKTDETRNVLTESARITRGNVMDIAMVVPDDLDALIFPGGFGAALNLSDFGIKGADSTVNPDVERLIHGMVKASKPIGVLCIAPAMAARAISEITEGAKLTIGNDKGTAEQMEKLGIIHTDCAVQSFVTDEKYKIVSTPAYMLGTRISDVAKGVNRLVEKVLSLIP
ncbi:MAG: isoprenoid biosynthesis glyoxalase ElbB [Candidatus Marinimicrobia bacterium]|nr:isoprenoid biosynthesis glyoxalase ElbB [Candidatus Neomarinimicrobiota bacterium]